MKTPSKLPKRLRLRRKKKEIGSNWSINHVVVEHHGVPTSYLSTMTKEDAWENGLIFVFSRGVSFIKRIEGGVKLEYTAWTVNDVLVDPYPFSGVKRVWINEDNH